MQSLRIPSLGAITKCVQLHAPAALTSNFIGDGVSPTYGMDVVYTVLKSKIFVPRRERNPNSTVIHAAAQSLCAKEAIFVRRQPPASRGWVCGRSLVGVEGLESRGWGGGIYVSCECCVLSGRDLCDRPIPRLEESYSECVCKRSGYQRKKEPIPNQY